MTERDRKQILALQGQRDRLKEQRDSLLSVCKALLALVDGAPRQYAYDPELQAVVDEARAAVAQTTGA